MYLIWSLYSKLTGEFKPWGLCFSCYFLSRYQNVIMFQTSRCCQKSLNILTWCLVETDWNRVLIPFFRVGPSVSSCWLWAGEAHQTWGWCSQWRVEACPRNQPGPRPRAEGVHWGSTRRWHPHKGPYLSVINAPHTCTEWQSYRRVNLSAAVSVAVCVMADLCEPVWECWDYMASCYLFTVTRALREHKDNTVGHIPGEGSRPWHLGVWQRPG